MRGVFRPREGAGQSFWESVDNGKADARRRSCVRRHMRAPLEAISGSTNLNVWSLEKLEGSFSTRPKDFDLPAEGVNLWLFPHRYITSSKPGSSG